MPDCLFKDPAAKAQQPLNRQEMWAAMQYKPILRTQGRWTYWDLLPDDVRVPPPAFCNELEDAPKQPPSARVQPKEKARPKHVPPSARPSPPPKSPQKSSWADATRTRRRRRHPQPSLNPFRSLRPARAHRARLSPLPRAPKSRSRSLRPNSTCVRQNRRHSGLNMPIPPSKRPLPSLPKHHNSLQGPRHHRANLDPADPATVYQPLSGQDIDTDSFRSLSQPGSFAKPYCLTFIFWIREHSLSSASLRSIKPLECMIWDRRPWICFYGGSPPTDTAQVDDWWYTLYDEDGGCCLSGWPIFRPGLYTPSLRPTAKPRAYSASRCSGI